MQAKHNRSASKLVDGKGSEAKYEVDGRVKLEPSQLDKWAKRYNDWHWGDGPYRVIDLDEPDHPKVGVQCGDLIRIHVRLPNQANKAESRHPRRQRDSMIEFSRAVSRNSHIYFDPEHQHERLYLYVDRQARPTLKRRFWDDNVLSPMDLNQVALLAGGRHAKNDYPDIEVKPIGVITAVVYFTYKAGDGKSYYIHKMGELSHHFPILCCDDQGRLWMAGGNYTVPNPGITD